VTSDPEQQAFLDKMAALKRDFLAKLGPRAGKLEAVLVQAIAGDERAAAEVTTIVHKLSGTAGSFDVLDLSETATALDLQLRAGATAAKLEAELRALIQLMRALQPPPIA